MAYAHCHNCGWVQDDFWHMDYHPLVANGQISWLKELLEKAISNPSERTMMFGSEMREVFDSHLVPYEPAGDGSIRVLIQDYVSCELKQLSDVVRRQIFLTEKDFVDAGRKCPRCDKELCVD